jgi:hypothetical protein
MKPELNLLVGSRALNFWYPSVPIKETTDWDLITSKDLPWAECSSPAHLNNEAFSKYNSGIFIEHLGEKLYIVNSKGLAIIKRSHLWRDLSFEKHMMHWVKYLKQEEKNFNAIDKEILSARINLTMQTYPQGHPKLNQSVKDFFNDAVQKKFSHDWLHELYAYYEEPLYKKLQLDYTKAWCNKALWNALSKEDQLKCIAEEAYVIATERMLVPKDYKYPARIAYVKAVNKICTTLCSGWFRDAAIDNYQEVIELFDQYKVESVVSVLKLELKGNLNEST